MKIGIDLGGTNVRAGLIEKGEIRRKIMEPTKAHLSEAGVLAQIEGIIRQLLTPEVKGIGIGVPSVVDAETGTVYNVANIPSWKEVPLKKILSKEFGLPVGVNNDCNCFALGECYFGEGKGYKDLVCVALGTGVGAGLIIDGKLFCGNNTGAGEIGCLPYLEQNYEYYCGSAFFSEMYRLTGKEAYERAWNGDPYALRLWKEIGLHIGELVKAILFAYDPQAIIFGGSISQAYEYFAPRMHECLAGFPYPETVRKVKILVSKQEDIALLGASMLV
ncbi:ROK family protein [Parabacteroides sp. Marseille-P3160]|uniref:ROK family protein n=1 Tax=Parabacteroides sp. Marseille-P3160 TaxID=1917887 RepID=UPI0009B9C7C3|nr:ROK family protein [Parabacteroides sp. Marseille-P3160]